MLDGSPYLRRAVLVQKETKEIVVERIRAEEAAARGAREGPKELGDIHTDDEEDEEAEYELWRQRELRRIRRHAPYPVLHRKREFVRFNSCVAL